MDVIVRRIGVNVIVEVFTVPVGVKLHTGIINSLPVIRVSDFMLFAIMMSFLDAANFAAILANVSFSCTI